jgi:hypothetical protein
MDLPAVDAMEMETIVGGKRLCIGEAGCQDL